VENLILGPVFEWLKQDGDRSKTGLKKCPENDRSKLDVDCYKK
jgi:hypothetical protein